MSTSLLSSDSSNSNSTIAEHLKWRKPRDHHNHNLNLHHHHHHHHNSRTPISDPLMPSIMQSTGCKSTISSLLLSTFSNNNNNNHEINSNNNNPRNTNTNNNNNGTKKSFKNSSLRGFGCTAQPEVAVPAVIRSSADWNEQEKKNNNNNKKKNNNNNNNKNGHKKKKKIQQLQGVLMEDSPSSAAAAVVGVQDLWCADSSAADSVDCVRPLSSRNKIDLDKLHHNRERALYANRQRVNAEQFAALDLDSAFELPPFGPDVFEARYYNHLRNRSPEGLAEILMFQNGLLTSRRSGGLDRYRDWRLDVDSMSYEELLELGERIGHVSTGLGEDQIGRCLRKTKLSVLTELPSQPQISEELEGKCSICQEEYDAEEELGKLECGHAYHLKCIEQWLVRKNACPVCKAEASSI